MVRKVIYTLLILVLFLIPSSVFADTFYTVDTGTIDNTWRTLKWDTSALVRWPDGTLHTTYNKLFGGSQEIYYAFSIDDGLNWTESRLTTVGHDQRNPSIALASNLDLRIVWAGRGGGSNPNTYALKTITYDASEATWSSISIIYDVDTTTDDYGVVKADIQVDGNDNWSVGFAYYDNLPVNDGRLLFLQSDFNGFDWDAWEALQSVNTGANDCTSFFSMAIDQDDNIGMLRTCNGNAKFYLRDAVTETWAAGENASVDGDDIYGSLMASISGGNTVWRGVWRDVGAGKVHYNERASGVWGAEANSGMNSETTQNIAQEHGTGDGDTGNWYAITVGGGNGFDFRRFELGVGWGATTAKVEDCLYAGATKALWPFDAAADWHWNMPGLGFVIMFEFTNIERYYISGTEWGLFQPGVTTGTPTDITATTATFHGTINYTGGATPTTIGWQYGHSQVATWTETQTGTFPADSYSAGITGLEADDVYYVRFFATNSEGTTYGDWIGFLSTQGEQSSPWNPVGNDTLVPVPSEPGDWFNPSPDAGNISSTWLGSILNPFLEASGFPVEFLWWVIFIMILEIVGIMVYGVGKHTMIVFIFGSVILGFICSASLIDWWLIFVYITVGIPFLILESRRF